MRIKRLPNVLALHLKRFKYIEQVRKRVRASACECVRVSD